MSKAVLITQLWLNYAGLLLRFFLCFLSPSFALILMNIRFLFCMISTNGVSELEWYLHKNLICTNGCWLPPGNVASAILFVSATSESIAGVKGTNYFSIPKLLMRMCPLIWILNVPYWTQWCRSCEHAKASNSMKVWERGEAEVGLNSWLAAHKPSPLVWT